MVADVGRGLLEGEGQAVEAPRKLARLLRVALGVGSQSVRPLQQELGRLLEAQLFQRAILQTGRPVSPPRRDQYVTGLKLGQELARRARRLLVVNVVEDHEPAVVSADPGE